MDNIEILKLKSEGLCCSQIMVRLVLDIMDRENPDLVRFARGLCLGHGSDTGACGILTASIGILALYLCHDDAGFKEARQTFNNDFIAMAGGRQACKEIAGPFYPKMNPDTCGTLLGQAHDRLMEILVEKGIDPADPETES